MNKHLYFIETWFHRVWTKEDHTAIFEMFRPEGKADGLGQDITGPKEFAVFHEAILKLISGIEVRIDDYMEIRDRVAAICTLTAKSKRDPSVSVEMKGSVFFTMNEDGVMKDADNFWDFLSLYEQLGLLPEDTFMRALSGEVIGAEVVK